MSSPTSKDSETFGEDFMLGGEDSLEDGSLSVGEEYTCKVCREKLNQPRLLSCLHTFCEECIVKLINEPGELKPLENTITCPDCQENTVVPSEGVRGLQCNYLMINMLDMCAIQDQTVVCTSCKTKEVAVSRCSDCPNFLCSNCNTAHQFMRCFEDHQVMQFEELRKSASEPNKAIPIHKPIFCVAHPTEGLKYFCHTCRTPICNDCMISNHVAPLHRYERLADAAPLLKEELEALAVEARKKATLCEVASADLQTALSELQAQHDAAQDLIRETYQSYKAILEKCRDDMLKNLKELHKDKELKIMDCYHSVEKNMNRVEDACSFTTHLLKNGNMVEIVSLKNIVSAQLRKMLDISPEPDISTSMEFITDLEKFKTAIETYFGVLRCGTGTMSCSGPLIPDPPTAHFPSAALPSAQTVTDSGPPLKASMLPNLPLQQTSSVQCLQTSVPPTPIGPPPGLLNGREDSSPSPTFSSVSTISNGERSSSGQCHSHQGFITTTASSLINGYASPTTSSPVSLQSSYDSEVSHITGFALQSSETPLTSSQFTSIQEYNLTQLANLADKVVEIDNARSVTPSPTPSVTLNDLLAGPIGSQNHALNNLQALAKLNLNDRDVSDGMNGGDPLLGRNSSSSPPNSALASLPSPTSSSNNFPLMSPTSSPLLNQSSEDLRIDTLNFGTDFGPVSPMFTMSTASFPIPRDPHNKMMAMQVRLKFGSMGSGKGQFSSPHGFCLGCDEDIVVADTNNHRIQVFDKAGTFKFQFGVTGKEEGQLYYPRKVAVIRSSGKFVVCDRGNERSRLQIFTKNGHFVRKIAIRYIEILAGLAVTSSGLIVAVDSVSPTVFVLDDTGYITRWFTCSDYMMEPSDITVSGNEFYVCDFKGHAVVVFDEYGKFQRRIGHEPVTNYPNGIDISDAGDVVVGDSHGNRFHVVVFNRNGDKLSEFECPYVKVSRCCGLKITSEGYVVTLAKNNHYVLVLNTLYIN